MPTRFACIPELRSLRFASILVLILASILLGVRAPSAAQADADPAPLILHQEYPIYLPVIRNNFVQYTVDVSNRQAVKEFFHAHYADSNEPPIEWTGSHDTCSPGSTNAAYQARILARVNYYRAMAGVPAEIIFVDDYNRKAQAAALLMSANDQLSHAPPITWTCYSQDAYDGASHSNIGLGYTGADGIDSFMKDIGSSNYYVGHRRWLLLPQTRWMGTGNVPDKDGYSAAYTLFVVDGEHSWNPRPTLRDPFIAWPPPGYTPYQVVFPRWSFSYRGADFTSAIVSMTVDGVPVPVTLEMLGGGAGDPTLVWRPFDMADYADWPAPKQDTTYSVTVSNFLVDGQPQTVTYNVIVFDPKQ